ncbi:MAG: hypothetical protein GX557_09645 [Chloroflexi bacterium]|nr:hypothetical protein [Chloroflexota bacterium]
MEALDGETIDIAASIRYQLEHLTDEQAALWYEYAGVEARSAAELAASWADWSIEGLVTLLVVRSERPDGEEADAMQGEEDPE